MEGGNFFTCALFKKIGECCVGVPHLHEGLGVGRGS
jgi:hypothetical protein